MSPSQPLSVSPVIFQPSNASEIQVISLHENGLTEKIVNRFLQTCSDGIMGMAPRYGPRCVLSSVAIASSTQVLVIQVSLRKPPHKRTFLKQLFLFPAQKFALQMDVLSTSLFLDLGLKITGGVDGLSMAMSNRYSVKALFEVLGGEKNLNRKEVEDVFYATDVSNPILALQAWAMCKAAPYHNPINKINTNNWSRQHLSILAKIIRDAQQREQLKPVQARNAVKPAFERNVSGDIVITSTRYKDRIRRNDNITRITTELEGGEQVTTFARVKRVDGRKATMHAVNPVRGSEIKSVIRLGREPPTMAEMERENILRFALQRTNTILSNPFVRRIWLPSQGSSFPANSSSSPLVVSIQPSKRQLNASQQQAVRAILATTGKHERIVLIHGPPGTGKTTVIASSVINMAAAAPDRSVWLIAQSNVAVKNIAEKLACVDFFNFKLLVSKDFHLDWHEHLYEKLEANIIRSDEFAKTNLEAECQLLDSKILLCTLSMFSNPKMRVYTRLAPVETVIFDEASQIEVGDYLPMLSFFQQTIQKMIFIGDDKQLPPHGESDIKGLQSIFEMSHLRRHAILLNTQYRMPVIIGRFISQHVYDGKLKSVHKNTSQRSCLFVNVASGKESRKGTSWANIEEVRAVIEIARRWHQQGKSYRIITPYDAQRSKIEDMLKVEEIPSDDKCFNVDSFQGNEDDHIIISIVRSEKIGFLREMRRVNVMLTRCKQSMLVCTSKTFLENVASETLVGKFAQELGPNNWVTVKEVTKAP